MAHKHIAMQLIARAAEYVLSLKRVPKERQRYRFEGIWEGDRGCVFSFRKRINDFAERN